MADVKYTTKSEEHGLTQYQVKLLEQSWLHVGRQTMLDPKVTHARFSIDEPGKCAFTHRPLNYEQGKMDPYVQAVMHFACIEMELEVYALQHEGVLTELHKMKNFGTNLLKAQGKEKEARAFYNVLKETLGNRFDSAHEDAWKTFLFHPKRLAN